MVDPLLDPLAPLLDPLPPLLDPLPPPLDPLPLLEPVEPASPDAPFWRTMSTH